MSGWLWNMTRWMAVFLGSYLVNQLTGSPFLVQCVGAALFAPMFFGGAIAGVVADRFDRRTTILRQLLLLTPLAVAMGALVVSGAVRVWMVYPFMLAVGVGGVVDMTSRRALVYDLVGERRATNALALETMSLSGGNTLGALFGGAVIQFVGIGEAFFLMAALYAGSFLLLLGVPSPKPSRTEIPSASVLADLRQGVAAVARNRTLVSLLGITVIMNLFYFSFMPLVPVFGERMEVSALLTGLLASALGVGMMLGAFMWAAWASQRRGLVYIGGSFVALTFLLLFAATDVYILAFTALIAAGIGASAFGTMQGVLTMDAAGPELRGRAMGVLSMAIGSLPFGMLLLGGLAQATTPGVAVALSVLAGFFVLGAWIIRFPEAARMR
jgi:MFS family permease